MTHIFQQLDQFQADLKAGKKTSSSSAQEAFVKAKEAEKVADQERAIQVQASGGWAPTSDKPEEDGHEQKKKEIPAWRLKQQQQVAQGLKK